MAAILGLLLAAVAPSQAAPVPLVVVNEAAPAPSATSRYYAVTLLVNFEPVKDLPPLSALKGVTVYQAKIDVFGKPIYFVRAGFFDSFAAAEQAKEKILSEYPAAWATAVRDAEFSATRGEIKRSPPPPPPSAPAKVEPPKAPPETFYVVQLESTQGPARTAPPGIPDTLRNYRLYVRPDTTGASDLYTLNLGFFRSEAEADRARSLLVTAFPNAQVRRVTQGEQDTSAANAIGPAAPSAAGESTRAASPTAAASPDIEERAAELMRLGTDALTQRNTELALRHFNEVLALPRNSKTAEAQEYSGLALERSGRVPQAKQAYEHYLELYPEGEDAMRVRQRLATLAAGEQPGMEPLKEPKQKGLETTTTIFGSLSQYYYRGAVKSEITETGANPGQASLDDTDQSALASNINLNVRVRNSMYDNRFVLRNNHTLSFLDGQDNINRLGAAYFEHKNRAYNYSVRVGRQPGYSGGVQGRFDGVQAGYNFLPRWRANVVVGQSAELPFASTPFFFGTSLEAGPFAENWSGSAYIIQQQVDGILDRRAIGGELRYLDAKLSSFATVDYDIFFKTLNVVLWQGTYITDGGVSINVLTEQRKTPVLQTSNALLGEQDSSIRTMLETLSAAEVRTLASARTPTSKTAMVGVQGPISPVWQLGGDIRLTTLSGIPASGNQPAIPGTGNTMIYTVQAIGSGAFAKRDLALARLSYLDNESYQGLALTLSHRSRLGERWTLEPGLRWYQQDDSVEQADLQRLTPSLRLGYQIGKSVTLEAEAMFEKTSISGPVQTEDTTRNFYFLGYRWDF